MEHSSGHLGLDEQLSSPQTIEKIGVTDTAKYKRGKKTIGTTSEMQAIIDVMFSLDPSRSSLRITWVNRLRYRGSEYEAGFTWLSATLDGKRSYAFIPRHGILESQADSEVWLFLELYTAQKRDHYGLPVLKISKDTEPSGRLVKLHSRKLTIHTTMSVARREVLDDGTVALRFAPLI